MAATWVDERAAWMDGMKVAWKAVEMVAKKVEQKVS